MASTNWIATFDEVLCWLQGELGAPLWVEFGATDGFLAVSFRSVLQRIDSISPTSEAAVLCFAGGQAIDIDPSELRIRGFREGSGVRFEFRNGSLQLEIATDQKI